MFPFPLFAAPEDWELPLFVFADPVFVPELPLLYALEFPFAPELVWAEFVVELLGFVEPPVEDWA